MLYRLAAAAAIAALGVAPAFAQNSSNITGTDRPVAQRGMQPDVGVPGVDGAPATITGDAGLATTTSDRSTGARGGASMGSSNASSSANAWGSSNMSTSGGASSSASSSMGAAPDSYPVCHTRSQDRCRVSNSRR